MLARRPLLVIGLALLMGLLALFALVRPIDHDESQYVAATALAGIGLHPYRDFAYLQTPLQPYLLGPPGVLFGTHLWLGLRLMNALFGLVAAALLWRAMQEEGATPGVALAAAGLALGCDAVLFSLAVARNDALPFLCLCAALLPIVRAERGAGTATGALITGLALAGAVAAKLSYAAPALAYGAYALFHRAHRPPWVIAGALPMLGFVGWAYAQGPDAFRFEVLRFGVEAPAQWYAAAAPFKLTLAGRAVDLVKFLSLGTALPALAIVAGRTRHMGAVEALLMGGVIAALLPAPTWRQYLLPLIPPLFLLLARAWQATPSTRAVRMIVGVFAAAGLAPSLLATAQAVTGPPLVAAQGPGEAIGTALDRAHILTGFVATLSPEMLPAARRLPDVRFATGPFYFRSHGLLDPATERRFSVVSRGNLDAAFAVRPAAILVGGEAQGSGDPALDRVLEDWAVRHRYRPLAIAAPGYRLYIGPDEAAPRLRP